VLVVVRRVLGTLEDARAVDPVVAAVEEGMTDDEGDDGGMIHGAIDCILDTAALGATPD